MTLLDKNHDEWGFEENRVVRLRKDFWSVVCAGLG